MWRPTNEPNLYIYYGDSLYMKCKAMTLCLISGLALGANTWADDTQLTGFDEDTMPALNEAESERSDWHFIAGGGVAQVPRYEGSNLSHEVLVPLLDASNGGFFVGTLRGIGYQFVNEHDLKVGVNIGGSPGRKESADPYLQGTGDIARTGEAGIFLHLRSDHSFMSSKVSAGTHGAHADLSGGFDFRTDVTDTLRIGAVVSWADAKYMQTYFGVSPDQSASSGFAAYDAAGSIQNYGLLTGWSHIFNRYWIGNLSFSSKRLSASARTSPLVQNDTSNRASIIALYLF